MAGLHRAGALLLAHGKAGIWAHAQAVAGAVEAIAQRHMVPLAPCVEAALCHDIGGILSAEEMLSRARALAWALDPAEERHPFLLHQRFSQRLCEERLGISDPRVLSAVGRHTTLGAAPSAIDMAVFLADKLAWDQPGMPPYLRAVEAALADSLQAACRAYIEYVLAHGMILMPHQRLLEGLAWLAEQDDAR